MSQFLPQTTLPCSYHNLVSLKHPSIDKLTELYADKNLDTTINKHVLLG